LRAYQAAALLRSNPLHPLGWKALSAALSMMAASSSNNPAERAIRPIALGRKNHLFAGSDGGGVRWAIVCSLITSAKLNNVEPFAYLRRSGER
jgi:transposase